jgi:hypothetical protein
MRKGLQRKSFWRSQKIGAESPVSGGAGNAPKKDKFSYTFIRDAAAFYTHGPGVYFFLKSKIQKPILKRNRPELCARWAS